MRARMIAAGAVSLAALSSSPASAGCNQPGCDDNVYHTAPRTTYYVTRPTYVEPPRSTFYTTGQEVQTHYSERPYHTVPSYPSTTYYDRPTYNSTTYVDRPTYHSTTYDDGYARPSYHHRPYAYSNYRPYFRPNYRPYYNRPYYNTYQSYRLTYYSRLYYDNYYSNRS